MYYSYKTGKQIYALFRMQALSQNSHNQLTYRLKPVTSAVLTGSLDTRIFLACSKKERIVAKFLYFTMVLAVSQLTQRTSISSSWPHDLKRSNLPIPVDCVVLFMFNLLAVPQTSPTAAAVTPGTVHQKDKLSASAFHKQP